jgi:hypothetical protein
MQMAERNRFPNTGDVVRTAVMFIAGALGIAIGFLITSNLPQFDDAQPDAEGVVADTTATRNVDASSSHAAPQRLLGECERLASGQVRVALAADTSLDQWRLHIQAMNQLVAGRISLDQANRYWERTRVGARRNAEAFMRQHHALHDRDLGCGEPGTASSMSARMQFRVEQCQRTIEAFDDLLHSAETAAMTWMHHIDDMDALRAGTISPAQATAMWRMKWHTGARELQAYAHDARAASHQHCG